jgi:hypothetical protein
MEYMHLGWYIILCGRNGEGYDSSSCTWSICILAGAGAVIIALTILPTYNKVLSKIHILHVQELLS